MSRLHASTTGLDITPASPADADLIAALIMPVIREGATYALDQDMTEAAALAYWLADDKAVFVARSGGALVGSYYLRRNHGGGGSHVANCGYVTSPAARGRGVARAMCAHSLETARQRGFTAMQFNFVVSTNAPALRLWLDMGFAVVGRLPEAFAHPELGLVDALVMHRVL